MARKLPPLNSLRAFEAAARHLSFSKAANELCVTQAAISHQVKSLEDYLSLALFIRAPRNLQLTEYGLRMLPVMVESLDNMADVIKDLRLEESRGMVKVRLAPSFSAKWLSPKLMDFWQQYPEVSLSMYHGNQAVDFAREDIDLAVTYGRGYWTGVQALPLMSLDYFPVASPEYLAKRPAIESYADMAKYYLLHDGDHDSWLAWYNQVGLPHIPLKSGYIFDDTNVVIQAALDGQGFALGSTQFIADHLQSGRLVKVFEESLETDYAYYVCCPPSHLKRPGVREFRDWIYAQSELGAQDG
ncbi:MAG: transcriptional regulator GcvA [Gammaproteobacteria bacterium]|jgi:LysR family glycine cleavage system transcriptional activator|nr:transcriptional regulator GcvA [Gammaproteobacteria bacterium]MCP4881037.1 transcriptional regulator GcvA [Gammaproteobacteria bacterium]MDP6165262.1 transcriptional regulator GcvA [Gammaproteobacteria bacterium]